MQPLAKTRKSGFRHFFDTLSPEGFVSFRGFFILGQKENVKFVEIPRANGYFFPVFLL